MDGLGQTPKYPEKPLYTHPPTGKRYTRAIFTAASMAHNGCVKPCCAKWIDPASPCPMEGQPGHCAGDPAHSPPQRWNAAKALVH